MTNSSSAPPNQHASSPPSQQRVANIAAHWIGTDGTLQDKAGANGVNQWLCFRREFVLEEVPNKVATFIAADSKYWLWLNGHLVVREGGLKRGPAPNATYIDELDLAPYLQVGRNTIAILLWHFGKSGFSHADSGQAAILLDANLGGYSIRSDESWKVLNHPAFSTVADEDPNFRLSESYLCFDARHDMPNWEQPGFNDSDWSAATLLGRAGDVPWGVLCARPIPQWRDQGIQPYPETPDFPLETDGKPITLRLPYNCQFTPYLDIESAVGQMVRIDTDHDNINGSSCVRAEYITREGAQQHEAWGWMNGHEVRYTFAPGTRIRALGFRETGYETEFVGNFTCDDKWLNLAWEKARRTLYVCMRDTFMDCPDRERAQWWGDVAIQAEQCFYALDTRSHALIRKGMLELANWQRADGALYSPIPGSYISELPTQMLASVGLLGFWKYYQHTGDRDTMEAVYPAVKRYLELWELGADGLVVERPGEWPWNDWGENKDQSLLYNGWYHLALQGQEQMAILLGHHDDLSRIRAHLNSISANYHNAFWNEAESAYISPAHDGPPDDRGQALAVLAGLAPQTCHEAIRQTLTLQRHASPYMEYYVLEALFQMGFTEDALARLRDRFGTMVDSTDSTLWEFWEAFVTPEPNSTWNGSRNHAWSGAPLTLLSQYVAGLRPTTPGYETFEVKPCLRHLKRVSQSVETVKGRIEVEIDRDAEHLRLNISTPPDTTATVYFPAHEGIDLRESGRPIGEHDGVAFVECEDGMVAYRIATGNFSFQTSVVTTQRR